MKKVLSVLLAASMVMGMSVTSMAADFFGAGDSDVVNNTHVDDIFWTNVIVVNEDGDTKAVKDAGDDYNELAAGDELYFIINGLQDGVCVKCNKAALKEDPNARLVGGCEHLKNGEEKQVDKDWIVKVNDEDFVEDIEFFFENDREEELPKGVEYETSYVKVTIADDFDHYNEDEKTNFWFYIYDTVEKTSSEKAHVKYDFEEYRQVILCEKCADGCSHKAHNKDNSHVVAFEEDGHKVPMKFDEPVEYILCDKCYTTSEDVVFVIDHEKKEIYFEATLIPGEAYLTTVYSKLDKDLTKAYDVDMTVLTIDTELRLDAIFESAKEDKVVLEVIDGELHEVESEFVTKYEVIEDEVLIKGYKVENLGNGQFVIVSEDADLEWEDTTRKEVVEAPAADDKANPSTGANDFVGAAVALAVVSVAAAGALAFKK